MKALPLLVALVALPGFALADDADLRALREEIAQLRESYETRLNALEQRLKLAESKAESVPARTWRAESPPATAPAATAGPQAFNPNISLILSGLYGKLSQHPAGFRLPGFKLPMDTLNALTPLRGFSLTETELGMAANIDPLFYGQMSLSIHPDNMVSTEEAFVQTTALPQGFTLKAGRWFSGIGYLNEQHAHTWDFVDAPLAYQAFLGGQFNNDGMQLRWLAPTETYLELGAELGRGANYPGTDRNKNGSGAGALFVHAGGDLGISHSWRAGLSMLKTAPQGQQWNDIDLAGVNVLNSFTGNSRLLVADAVWKWSPYGNATSRSLKVQGEYFRRTHGGTLTYDLDAASTGPLTGPYASVQSGGYLQGIYQFAQAWRLGFRRERLAPGRVDYGINNATLPHPDPARSKSSLMVDFNPSEFSRLRLQWAEDKFGPGISDKQIFLQYQMSLGAHGAHKF